MKKYKETPLVDEYLESLSNMKAAETDPFFYTRLKARMERILPTNHQPTNIKWAFVICTFAIFLAINCWILLHPQATQNHQVANAAQQSFADAFAIGNSPSY